MKKYLRLVFLITAGASLCLLSSCEKKKDSRLPEKFEMPDSQDQSDIFAIPFDSSGEEDDRTLDYIENLKETEEYKEFDSYKNDDRWKNFSE